MFYSSLSNHPLSQNHLRFQRLQQLRALPLPLRRWILDEALGAEVLRRLLQVFDTSLGAGETRRKTWDKGHLKRKSVGISSGNHWKSRFIMLDMG